MLLLGPFALADTDGEDAGKRLVEEFVLDVKTFQGRFDQSLLDANGQVVEVTSGSLEIQRPGQFRWVYVEPYEQWLIADGLNIWSYDVDLEQVTVKPQTRALANTPALLLGGGEGALDQFDYEGSYVESHTTWVRLSPKNKKSGFVRVELGFKAGALYRMAFFDNLEQTTLITLSDVLVNEPIDPSHFEFTVPDDVDVVGSPAIAGAPDR